MTTSYSDKLRLAIQGDGDNPNTWGQIANNGVFELIEDAIAGYLALNVSGGSNITLTTTNGVTDQARNAMLTFTGTLINDINVIVPTVTKFYIVNAQQAGGFNVVLKTAAGTGVTFPNGKKSLVYCDGVNVIDVQPTLGALAFLNSVGAAQIDDGSIGTAELGDAQVTEAKLAAGLATKYTLPAGVLLPYAETTAPTGYLVCDGSAVSRTTYSGLFAVCGVKFGAGDGSTTFNLPDLRGQFIRGWSDNVSQDPGGPRVVGAIQSDAFQGHFHSAYLAIPWDNIYGREYPGNANYGSLRTPSYVRTAVTDGVNGEPRTASETRPKNIAFGYIIKT